MIVCDKCKKEIYLGSNESKVTFSYYEQLQRPVIPESKFFYHEAPVKRELSVDLCPNCQRQIITSILGRVPWETLELKEGESCLIIKEGEKK